MIKSPLLKRIIILVFSTILISAGITAGIYSYVAKDTFVQIRATELLPAAQNIANYISNTWTGDLSSQSMLFFDENFKVLDAQIHLYDKNGNAVRVNSNNNLPSDTTTKTSNSTGTDKKTVIAHATPSLFTSNYNRYSALLLSSIMQSKTRNSYPINSLTTVDQLMTSRFELSETQRVLADVIPSVLKNNTVNTIKQSSQGNDYLVVSVPIVKDGVVVGAVAFAKPIKEFTAAISGLTTTLLFSMLASLLVMLIPSYYASRRIVVPIRQMRDVSLSIAEGDYSKRADESQKGEIGELAKALNKCSIESEHLEQTRRDYVANVSHELRTPIASIRAIAETLKDGLVKSDAKKDSFYGSILNESMRLSALVDDLLELSRLQSGTTTFEKEAFNVRALLKNSMDLHSAQLQQKGLSFDFNMPSNLPKVFSNSARIEQVFVAILDNAIKHTNEGGKIALSATWDKNKIYLSVSDTGEGISKENLEHIFDRFYKVDTSHSSGGTGLGLSIALEVLTLLGEKIEVQSELGVGTTFTFTVSRA